MTEIIETSLSNHEDLHLAQDWLDALAGGTCDEAAFIRAVPELTRRSPDAGWDLLSLLDQYYRRGKISPELFNSLKSSLQRELLGPALDIDISVPIPAREAPAIAGARPTPTPAPPREVAARDVPSREGAAPAVTPAETAAREVPPPPVPRPREVHDPAARVDKPPLHVVSLIAAEHSQSAHRTGEVLRGRYLLQNVIGRGGTGAVFEAIDQFKLDLPNADRRLAIKVLNPSVCERPELLADLRREFQNLQGLAHPNIVRAFEYDRDGDRSFFTMEFLSGLSLSRVLAARQELPLERAHALAIVRDIGGALAHAHGRGVVHGDLNPANVFLTDEGDVRVLDFGGARLSLSDPGVAAPRYASCQVLEGERVEPRDDVYSLACIVYLLLTGAHAYGERTSIEARSQRARPARPRGLPSAAWVALRTALAFERERRPADLTEWLKAFDFRTAANQLPPLLALLRPPTSAPRRSPSTVVLVIFLLLLGGAVGWILAHPQRLRGALDTFPTTLSDLGNASSGWLTATRQRMSQWTERSDSSGEPPGARPLPAPTDAVTATPAPPQPRGAAPVAASTPGVRSSPGPGSAPGIRSAAVAAPAAVVGPRTAASPSAVAASTPSVPRPHTAMAAPPARIEFAASTVDVPPAEPAALVLVKRSGNVHGDSSFSWWTESGTAKPGEDFSPVAPHVEHFTDGESSMRLSISLAGVARQQARSFYVVLSDPSEGTVLGNRSLAMVTLPPAESSAAPP